MVGKGFLLEINPLPGVSSRGLALLLFALSFAIYSFLVVSHPFPFVFDEGVYSLSVKEFSDNPSTVMPTVTGVHVEWKPPLFTWVYSVFYKLLSGLPVQVETIFRLPSAFFSAINAALVFLLAERMYGRRVGLASSLLFLVNPLTAFSAMTAMMEAFSLTLILATMLCYLRGSRGPGAAFLAMLTLTKWLYVAFPVVFITLYFLRSKELRAILLSFLAVPAALAAYLLLAFLFGSYGNALYNLALDLSRSSPHPDLRSAAFNFIQMTLVTFPLSLVALALLLSKKPDIWEERHILALCAAGFVLLFAGSFIFWYLTPVLPAFAILVAKRAEEFDKGAMLFAAITAFLAMSLSAPLILQGQSDLKDVAIFMKGKQVSFLEPYAHYPIWERVNALYHGTPRSYLLLEQLNSGLLFYRFSDSSDYGDLRAVLSEYNETPSCGGYLVVHRRFLDATQPRYNWSVPGCFTLLWENGYYSVYGTGNSSAGSGNGE